jgi:hypothetical protein
MHNPSAPTECFALQVMLAKILRKSLNSQSPERSQLVNIPLNRVKNSTQPVTQVKYVSAIALKLTPYPQDALSLAQQIAKNLHQAIQFDLLPPFSRGIGQDLKISTAAPGWIYLELSAAGLAVWLQHAVSSVLTLKLIPTSNSTLYEHQFDRHAAQIFVISYGHARCCSLLSAADREWKDWRLAVAQPDLVAIWQPAEWELIGQLVDAVDQLALSGSKSSPQSSPARLVKLAYEISLGFESFYAASPMGGIAAQDGALATRRLGLVLLTQRLLQLILGLLDLPAPAQF